MGMFDEASYQAQPLDVAPGDRLIIASDGVHASPAYNPFGASALTVAITHGRLLLADETVRHLIAALHTHHENAELDDDAVVACIDWTSTG